MAKQRFTADRVKNFPHPNIGQDFYWDEVVRGLGIRVTPSSKVYVFQSRMNGKSLRIKIGDVKTWVIDSNDPDIPGARQEARRLQALVDKGIDPRLEKHDRLEKQADKRADMARHETTLADAWPIYLEDRKSQWSDRHYKDHQRIADIGGRKKKRGKGKTKPAALAALVPYRLTDITPATVETWIKEESAKRSAQARLAFSLLRAFANWCEDQGDYKGLCDLSAFSGKVKRNNLPKQEPRSDSLQREQLKSWFAAVRKCPNRIISAYLQTLLLTGARREELLNLKWSDVDFTWQSLTIKDKVDSTRAIPLTPYVSNLLVGLPQRNQCVFSSTRAESGRLQEPRKAHNLALAEAGIEGLTIHGLRRSFSNLTEWVETPVGIVYQIMGHKPSATAEKHYKQRPLDLLRMWHTKIEAWILEQAEITQPKPVGEELSFKVRKAAKD